MDFLILLFLIAAGFVGGIVLGEIQGYERAYTHYKTGTLDQNMRRDHFAKWKELNKEPE